jgi:polysaccharide export outer membrane protein
MLSRKSIGRWTAIFGLLFSAFFLTGCQTTPRASYAAAPAPAVSGTNSIMADGGSTEAIHVGDSLIVVFSDVPGTIPPFEVRVNDEGSITLYLNEKFMAAGKTRAQLEKEIRERYVPRIYVRMTVTIKPQERMYYVTGEVRSPGPKMYLGPLTVLQAISSAGDFTDYSRKSKVTLTRVDGKKQTINCTKAIHNPRLDLPVYPGDTIRVPRSVL